MRHRCTVWPLLLAASLASSATPPPIPAIEAPTFLVQLRDPTLDRAARVEAAHRVLDGDDAVGTLAPILKSGVHSLPI
ncbi:MAG: hypothetical protein KDA28_13560, partial [Phycisphaerales bacterium]|nr:hypothetical protein [Phycisphaerales bacterium]